MGEANSTYAQSSHILNEECLVVEAVPINRKDGCYTLALTLYPVRGFDATQHVSFILAQQACGTACLPVAMQVYGETGSS